MRFPLLASRMALVVACVACSLGSNERAAWAAVCHDGVWEDGEFCGRDAYLVTGETEMNHDCFVDWLDLRLFAAEFALTGPNLSADFNGDVASFALPVSPCSLSGTLPDRCEGTIALSFDSNPATLVSTQAQAPGQHRVYVVVDGWTSAELIEYAVETSSNVKIVNHPPSNQPHWAPSDLQLFCDPDLQHSLRGFISVTGSWPAGPIAYNYLDYQLLDTDPAWIQLVPVPACYSNSRIRWAKAAANRSYDFETVLNVGINGPAPEGESTCVPPQLPGLNPQLMWLPAAIVLGLAVVFLRRRSRASAPVAPSPRS